MSGIQKETVVEEEEKGKKQINKDCHRVRLQQNSKTLPPDSSTLIMELSDSRNRAKRKLPAFMYGATFPRDAIGSGGPSYGGAQEWISKHQDYMNQAVRYIQRYPNLVEDPVMDTFWDFIEPLVYNNNLLIKYDEFLKTQFGFNETFQLGDHFHQSLPTAAAYFKPDIETRRSDYTYPIRRAFFCYDRTDSYQQSLKHLIVDQLEPFLSIRTNPTPDQAKVMSSMDICRQICGSVFIVLMNDNVLKDQVCMNLLTIAISYKTPIIFLRESGYTLPLDLPDTTITFVKIPDNAPFNPKQNTMKPNKVSENPTSKRRFTREGSSSKPDSERESEDVSVKALKEREQEAQKKADEANLTTSLTLKIKENFANALVFNTNMFETTLNALYDKVSSFTGAAFPGEAPKLSMDAAAALNKPFHLGSMTSRDKPLYRVGTARTTKGFHDSLEERKQLHDRVYANDINNNNNDSEEPKERRDSSDSTQSAKDESLSPSSDRATVGRFTPPYAKAPQLPLEPAIQATVIEGLKPSILIPAPPKVMRSDNLRGQLTSPHYKSFRPNYPSNSKLLKYRPGSSRPSSARTRILLQSTLQQRQSDMDWD